MKKPDHVLMEDVMNELKWEPILDASEIGVKVKEGIVTLYGNVNSYPQKWATDRAVKRVSGVKAVADEVEVILKDSDKRSDEDIARSAINALQLDVSVPAPNIRVIVSKGWVTLEGEVEWMFQKDAAKSVVKNIKGVNGVTNLILIIVNPGIKVEEIRAKIINAFKRNAGIDATRIDINVEGNKVTLYGNARTWAEREDAERAAWGAPGINSVENNIEVNYDMQAV